MEFRRRAISMFISSSVNVNLKGLEQFGKAVVSQLNGAPGPVHDALKLWAVRYRSFAQIRFDLYSRGGGDWQKLALSTLKKRRKGTKSNVLKLREILAGKQSKQKQTGTSPTIRTAAPTILRDTGLLFAALAPVFAGAPGA
jgi:hypothetical protein